MTTQLTTADIEAGYANDEWLGFGYLGERSHRTRSEQDRGDAFLLRYAAERRWTRDELFTFANSRDGRWFGDLVFGGWDDAEVERQAPRLLRGW